jgi:hypothetical protein
MTMCKSVEVSSRIPSSETAKLQAVLSAGISKLRSFFVILDITGITKGFQSGVPLLAEKFHVSPTIFEIRDEHFLGNVLNY